MTPCGPPPYFQRCFSLPLYPIPSRVASLFGSSMDVLTQLEQACAHGCVLLSDTFAVALRPTDPALIGDSSESSLPPPPPDSDATAPPPGPAEGDEAGTVGSGIPPDPLLRASRAPVPAPSRSSSSLRRSLSTAATSLQGAASPSVTVRRLGSRRVSIVSPSALLPGAAAGAASGVRLMSASASTGDVFGLLPAGRSTIVG